MTFVLGLTGSIATGKSTVLGLFGKAGIPVVSADEIVHELYRNEAVAPVGALFPEAVSKGEIDRGMLAASLAGKSDRLNALEKIVHPMVRQKIAQYLDHQRRKHAELVVVEIPLLFETNADYPVDAIAVTWCDPALLRQRALARPGMNVEKLEAILARQLPQDDKKQRADFLIDTGVSLAQTAEQVTQIIADCRRRGERNTH